MEKKSTKMIGSLSQWKKLLYLKKPVAISQIDLSISLFNGQAFTWFQNETKNEFWGTSQGKFFVFKYSEENELQYRTFIKNSPQSQLPDSKSEEIFLTNYFSLNLDYKKFEKVAEKDKYFKECWEKGKGMRVLRQDPWECFISFLCSQNNNVKRIHQMITKLCQNFGDPIAQHKEKIYYSFPSVEKVAQIKEQQLRDLGFGYRAAYITKSSKELLKKGGMGFLTKLRAETDSEHVVEELKKFTGVGPKVADCISLFSLDCYDHVPMDTHMKRVYKEIYKQGEMKDYLKAKKFFVGLFGPWAGIAHSFLFTEQLEKYKKKQAFKLLAVGEEVGKNRGKGRGGRKVGVKKIMKNKKGD